MPRLPDDLTDTAVYLYATEQAAREGSGQGGTGFITGVRANVVGNQDYFFRYAVTNAHVIVNGFPVVRLNRLDGRMGILNFDKAKWITHPNGDDVAVYPFSVAEDNVHFKIIPSEAFLTEEMVTEYDIGIGDEAFLVGRFMTHEGRVRNMPAVRMGVLSMMPGEPITNKQGKWF